MSEKPISGGFVAGAAALMVVCCLAPVLFVSFGAGLWAWLGGLTALEIAGAAVIAGVIAYAILRRKRRAVPERDAA